MLRDRAPRPDPLAARGAGRAPPARPGRRPGGGARARPPRRPRAGGRGRLGGRAPGATGPGAGFPGDDVIVTALRADFSGVETVTLSVTGPADSPFGRYDDVPVPGPNGEVLWATPAALVQQLPSMRLELTLRSTGAAPTELGRYVLDHAASPPPG